MAPRFYIAGVIGEDTARAQPLGDFLTANPGWVDVIINSPGGDASEGAAMLAELQRHDKAVVTIEGIAASAASLVAMGGREIVMHPAAAFMIHDPSTIAWGTADDLRQTAKVLDKVSGIYAAAYSAATGHPVEMIAHWMAEETWLSADEALALHFIDRVEGAAPATPAAPVLASAFDYSRFRSAPEALLNLARASGWATVSPGEREQGK